MCNEKLPLKLRMVSRYINRGSSSHFFSHIIADSPLFIDYKMNATKKALFSPIKVGHHQLQHRIVMAPLTRRRATVDHIPTDLQVEYYKQRANPGGLMITEATFISRRAGCYPCIPGIYNEAQIAAWKKVTTAVHDKTKQEEGAAAIFFLQLWHLGRVGSKKLNPNEEPIVAPSPIKVAGFSTQLRAEYELPHALEIDEIKAIVQDYRQAALNAIEAGFDGVEIHGAFGYLVDQFINSGSNKRTDIYGGSIENRARFPLEIIDAIVDAIGAERTAIRFSPGGTFQDMQDDAVVETWSYLTSQIQFNQPNLAYVHFQEERANVHADGQANNVDSLEPYRKLWKGPFISSGGFSTAIEHAIDVAERTGDLISFGRAYIANPDLPERLRNGWELNNYDRPTFYTTEPAGYTDYPFYNQIKD
jgi:2,4-dienoyl-CoA reductase-like NADH-dependent reductase (Old Yellow Enzyme family)